MEFKFSCKKGFSIGEVLIALFVLTFGIVTAIYLMSGSMQDTMRSRDLLVAEKLSQEGTELVRNIRDNNVTEKTGSLRNHAFEGFPSSGKADCIVDYDFSVITNNDGEFRSALDCSPSSFKLYLSENSKLDTFLYTHKGGAETKFRRKIIIESKGNDIKEVISMVIWGKNDFPDSINNCNIGQDCMFSKTGLTTWLDNQKN